MNKNIFWNIQWEDSEFKQSMLKAHVYERKPEVTEGLLTFYLVAKYASTISYKYLASYDGYL